MQSGVNTLSVSEILGHADLHLLFVHSRMDRKRASSIFNDALKAEKQTAKTNVE